MSCLGRERIFDHGSETLGTPTALIRLNYANELRYGVLADLARNVFDGRPIDLNMGYVNVIWQGDANAMALQAFDHAASPPFVVNVAGPQVLRVRDLATEFGRLFGKPVTFQGNEAPDALLSNAQQAVRLFGPPRVSVSSVDGMDRRLGRARGAVARQADPFRGARWEVLRSFQGNRCDRSSIAAWSCRRCRWR